MDSGSLVKVVGGVITGAVGVSVLQSYVPFWGASRNAVELKSDQAADKDVTRAVVLFFNDQSTFCYADRNHTIDDCPRHSQCPQRHVRTLLRQINRAVKSVDVCLYNLSHNKLEEALIKALQQGRKVRCVVGESRDRGFINRLRSEGAFVVEKPMRPPPGNPMAAQISDLLMHHKFVIIDSKALITGSMNWTNNSFSRHWDHMIISTDAHLVGQFLEEFNYLHTTSGDAEMACTLRPKADLPFQACFFRRKGNQCRPDANRKKKCERQDCMFSLYKSILHKIISASTSIDICVQQITIEDLSNELVFCHESGVKVRVVCEEDMSGGTGSQIRFLMKEGVPVHMQEGIGVLHHKFIIVDKKILLTGSLNWTMQSFFGNYENVLIITDKNVVQNFQDEYEQLWDAFPAAK